jgi:hypothetical protein
MYSCVIVKQNCMGTVQVVQSQNQKWQEERCLILSAVDSAWPCTEQEQKISSEISVSQSCSYKSLARKPEGKRLISIHWRILLKWILKKWGVRM